MNKDKFIGTYGYMLGTNQHFTQILNVETGEIIIIRLDDLADSDNKIFCPYPNKQVPLKMIREYAAILSKWVEELGVDADSCKHVNKNYSQVASTACAVKYRIVFWECEECGYLQSEQPTKEELGVES